MVKSLTYVAEGHGFESYYIMSWTKLTLLHELDTPFKHELDTPYRVHVEKLTFLHELDTAYRVHV